jgi:Tol biopolymer transport system component
MASVVLVLADPAAAQVTSVNGKIAYTTCDYSPDVGENVCDIWVMNPDGSEQTNLTNTPTLNEMGPAWSPDGTRIAYTEGFAGFNRLMVMNADGTNQVAVTATPDYQFGPSWSPDGTQIAFVREVPGEVISIQFDILVVSVDGAGERNITSSDFDELDPAWSPDGAKIAFAGVRPEMTVDPETGDPIEAAQWEIVTVNPDGSGETVLSAGDPGSERALLLEDDRAPAWSPDGRMLVFMSQSVDPCCPPWQIWIVNRDGTGAVVLSDNPEVNDLFPSFSPDGTLIVFSSDRDATVGGQLDVYTMPAPPSPPAPGTASRPGAKAPDGPGTVTRLTFSGNASDPSWGREPDTTPPPESFTLSVTLAMQRRARGMIVSLPAGIFCGLDCSKAYPAGTEVVLSAIPGRGSRFAGWSGACTGTRLYCRLDMTGAKEVGATFVGSGRQPAPGVLARR